MSTCHCVDVAMGSYDNQVDMRTPAGEWVCIDTCLATEIGRLWHLGVTTLNSCCGHQKVSPSVIVAPESHDLMDRLGYTWTPAPSGLRSYSPPDASHRDAAVAAGWTPPDAQMGVVSRAEALADEWERSSARQTRMYGHRLRTALEAGK